CKKNLFLFVPLTIFLQACGGSGSSSESEPVEPVEYTFSLTSQLTNSCGVSVPFTHIELLLQDNDWQTVASHQADENGVITFTSLQARLNYTLVAKNQHADEAEGLNIVSFFQAKTTTPAMYHAQFDNLVDNSSCECVTQDVELKHRPFALRSQVTSSLNFETWSAVDDQTTIFENVMACREIEGEWPLQSFSVLGEDVNQQEIGTSEFLADFSENVEGVWSVPAFQVADLVELSTPHEDFSTLQLIQTNEHFLQEIVENQSHLLLFKSHPYVSETFYQSNASVTFQETSSIFGDTTIKSHHQLISANHQQSFEVEASKQRPEVDDINFSEIKADGSYDYSAVSGYPMAVISFSYTAYEPQTQLLMPATWTHYGREQGTIAMSGPLTGYENIINSDTAKKSTKVLLQKSSKTSDYFDYIEFYQGGNLDKNETSLLSDFRQYEIEISLN
ncbi:MAG: hypothetical protein OQK03_11035, partial [Colwellia sp.]|nr:hypothetical protein [Colwellia sp.]